MSGWLSDEHDDSLLTCGDVADRPEPLPASTTCVEGARYLDANPHRGAVVVRGPLGDLAFDRDVVYSLLVGPRGYGRALNERRLLREAAKPIAARIGAGVGVVDAGVALLSEGSLGDGHVVVDYRDGQIGTLAIGRLFAAVGEAHEWQARRAARAERRFRSLVEHASDVCLVLDDAGVVSYVSPAVAGVTGTSTLAVGRNILGETHPDDREELGERLSAANSNPGKSFTGQFRLGDGSDGRTFEYVVRNLVPDPDVAGVVVNFRDVTERTRLEANLRSLAFTDPVTGLPNRRALVDAVSASRGAYSSRAVLFCDLDGFKIINDTLGHVTGDELLKGVGERLRSCVRDGDLVARIGGDEFAVLVNGDASDARSLAERILAELAVPIALAGHQVRVGVSIGLAAGDGGAGESLLQQADVAMYAAKSAGKRRYAIFAPEMQEEMERERLLTNDFERGRHSGEFFVEYQPIVALESLAPVGAEALVRWEHHSLGRIEPASFIPLAERSGWIVDLGALVLETACREAKDWRGQVKDLFISVNLSPRQLVDPSIAHTIAEVIRETGIDASRLQLELTEESLVGQLDVAQRALHRLKDLGTRIALDDFGAGQSNLAYLRRFPVDALKLDRSFLDRLALSSQDRDLVRAVIAMAHALGIMVTAEGIEDARQLTHLKDMGCDLGQGFLFSRPLPASSVVPLLAAGGGGMLSGVHPSTSRAGVHS